MTRYSVLWARIAFVEAVRLDDCYRSSVFVAEHGPSSHVQCCGLGSRLLKQSDWMIVIEAVFLWQNMVHDHMFSAVV